MVIALFVFFQAGSGLLITVSELGSPDAQATGVNGHGQAAGESNWLEGFEWIHHGSGQLMGIYRLLLGIGILGQAVIGLMIFFDMKRRRPSHK